jgi:hypothetical protein
LDVPEVDRTAIYNGEIGYHIETTRDGVEIIHLRRYQQQAPTGMQLGVAPVQRFDADSALKELYDGRIRQATLTLQNGQQKSVAIYENYNQIGGYLGMKTTPHVDLRNITAVSGVVQSL